MIDDDINSKENTKYISFEILNTVKPASKRRPKIVFQDRLMQVKSMSIQQYFRPPLSYLLSLPFLFPFLSRSLRQVILYCKKIPNS